MTTFPPEFPSQLSPDLAAAIAREFPADFLTVDAAEREEYGRDWTRVYAPAPAAVAFPRTTAEVSRLLALCHAARFPVVPSGGRTGLAGGAMATRGELVVSMTRMRRMDAVDELGATVRVQAGAVTEAVHRHVSAHGLIWPVDFASKGSSQIGGNIATNAGGVRVIRYGLTRQWVLGLQVVLASGAVLEANGALEKNNTGLDLRQLFIGSEGTLGIITEATLKLTAPPAHTDVLLFAVPDLAGVLRLFRAARRAPFTIAAFEFFTEACRHRLERHRGVRSPLGTPASHYVLLEAEAPGPDARRGLDGVDRRAGAGPRRDPRRVRGAGGRSLGAAGGDQREPLRHRLPPQERHRAAGRGAGGVLWRARRPHSSATIRAGRSACSATSATATCTST